VGVGVPVSFACGAERGRLTEIHGLRARQHQSLGARLLARAMEIFPLHVYKMIASNPPHKFRAMLCNTNVSIKWTSCEVNEVVQTAGATRHLPFHSCLYHCLSHATNGLTNDDMLSGMPRDGGRSARELRLEIADFIRNNGNYLINGTRVSSWIKMHTHPDMTTQQYAEDMMDMEKKNMGSILEIQICAHLKFVDIIIVSESGQCTPIYSPIYTGRVIHIKHYDRKEHFNNLEFVEVLRGNGQFAPHSVIWRHAMSSRTGIRKEYEAWLETTRCQAAHPRK
jgi:hypothetical protein